MQHRYKINTSNQARKSSTNTVQSQKTDTLSYINLLDKCTQILREDRIWIRNQLKANDQQIIKIFRQAKRPLNLQHLQIRLRKHVTAVKSKAKMEQLMKFKQNMHLGDWTQPDQKPHLVTKKDTVPKYHLPTNPQATSNQTRGLQTRMNSSMDKQTNANGIYPYRNTSVNNKKSLDQYNVPMEQITERQSENMTSARNRVLMDDGNNQNFTFSHTYQQWKRPDQPSTHTHTNIISDPFKPKHNTNTYFNNFIGVEKQQPKTSNIPIQKVKSPMNKTQPRTSLPAQQKVQPKIQSSPLTQDLITNIAKKSNKMHREPQDQFEQYSPKKQLKQDYPSSSNFSASAQDNGSQSQVISHSYLQQYSPQYYKPQGQNNYTNILSNLNNYQDQHRQFKPQTDFNYTYTNSILNSFKPTSIDQTDLLHSKNNTTPFSSNSNTNGGDSLFTSPQLLAQCRNFLKLKSSAKPSMQKDFSNNKLNIQHQVKLQPLKFDNIEPFKSETKKQSSNHYSNSQSNSMMQILNQINCGMTQSISGPQLFPPMSSNFGPQPSYPQNSYTQSTLTNIIPPSLGRQTVYKRQNIQSPNNPNTAGLQQYFHTFAALSSQKKPQPQPQLQEQYPEISCPEQFVDLVFNNLTDEQIEGYVYWHTLQKLVQKRLPYLADSFRQYLLPTQGQKLVLISNIGRLLQDNMPNTQPIQNDARNIYRLLDIQQKGYIVQQDINDFITQLQDSDADDLQIISQYLWRLYETIDANVEETDQKKIDYWGIYSKKHSPEFEQLNEILKQFQFQIE